MRLVSLAALLGIASSSLLVFIQCSPAEDGAVDMPTACAVNELRPATAETTVKVFHDSARAFRDRAKELETQAIAVCNAINRDLGAPEGPDLRAACNPIAARLAKAQGIVPADAGTFGVPPQWVRVASPVACVLGTEAEVACLAECAPAPCDATQACPAGKLSGTCAGTCTGTCSVTGTATPCFGDCQGSCLQAADGGVASCVSGECTGKCNGAPWTGQCSEGCDARFLGVCQGTCTGTCDGRPIGAIQPDAGADAGPGPAPGGADGNCTGVCQGQCSKNASGSCGASCRGTFAGGSCGQAAGGPALACGGACSSPSNSCVTACNGTCASKVENGACAGSCTGACSVPMTNATCADTALNCEASEPCKRTCAVAAALSARCQAPLAAEVRIAGDFAIYAAVKAHAVELAAITEQATLLNEQSVAMSRLTLADFAAIGAGRDRARLCAIEGADTLREGRGTVSLVVAAGQVLNGLSF